MKTIKAVKKTELVWGEIKIPVDVVPLVDEKTHQIPKEIEIHKKCNQEVIKGTFCPNCQKPLRVRDLITCPSCKEIFEPLPERIESFCKECNQKVEEEPISGLWCPKCQKKVTEKETKKAFVVNEKLISLSSREREEWKKLWPEKIEVRYPVRINRISPLMVKNTYGLRPSLPRKKSEKEKAKLILAFYSLFNQMLEGGKIGLVTDVAIRTFYPSLIISETYKGKNVLILVLLREDDKIVIPDIPEIELPWEQVAIGQEALNRMGPSEFSFEKDCRNRYREYLEQLIEKKEGKKKVLPKPATVPPPRVIEEMKKAIEKMKG